MLPYVHVDTSSENGAVGVPVVVAVKEPEEMSSRLGWRCVVVPDMQDFINSLA